MLGILYIPNIELKIPIFPGLLVITLLTGVAVDKCGSMGRKERCLRLETLLLFCSVLGASEQKKLVYIKDTKSFSGFKNVVLTFGSVILF